jgi:MFS family permease
MIVQMIGIVSAQGLMVVADPGGFILFIIPSVLISLSFAPILLSISPTPAFATTKPMSLREIMKISPLGCVGMFLLGGIFSAQFGMAAVYGARAGLSVGQISMFVSAFYVGALLIQYPLGWLSDRMDRRLLIMVSSVIMSLGALVGMVLGGWFPALLVSAFVVGGLSNPLYSLLIAYTCDFLEHEDMAAASGGMVFINGLGAVAGPVITGWMIGVIGPHGFFLFIGGLGAAMAAYAAYRMTQRAAPSVEDTESFATVMPSSSPMAVSYAQEYAIDVAQEDAEEAENTSNVN